MAEGATVIARESDSSQALLEAALQHHQAGRRRAAQRIYRQVLERDPDNANALNLMGLLAHQEGRHEEAAALLARAIARQPGSALFQRNYASVLQAAGDLTGAVAAYRAAERLAPEDAGILSDLGTALNGLGQIGEAAECFRRAVAIAPGEALLQYNLANALLKQGEREKAVAALRRALTADPGLERARHVLTALTGGDSRRPPDDYVRALFDDYAPRFEADLVDNLGYRVPEALREAVLASTTTDAGAPPRFAETLDLGCGTGLSGAAFRDLTDRLTGIDLSPGMIAEAARRRIYDDLVTCSIAEYWRVCKQRFDLFLATDVFIYVGDLRVIFAAVRRQSAPAAVFAFSTELLDPAEDAAAAGVVLRPSGRYAHAPAYIADLAASNGFAVLRRESQDLRRGEDGPVAGELYVLQA